MHKEIVIIGLGLIGGSLAKALRGFEDYTIVGCDVSQPTLRYALEQGVIDIAEPDAAKAVARGELIFLCMHPRGIIDFLQTYKDHFKSGSMINDVCGVKTQIISAAEGLPAQVSFLGGHPMAGTEHSGIEHSLVNMFHGAHYILTPTQRTSSAHLALMHRVATHLGCADVVETTPQKHDAMIAYTSQMMHVIAVAVCDDPNLFEYQGFEGDSFRGCTRVAALDVPLWTDLFSLNAPALSSALAQLEAHLHRYRAAIDAGDSKALGEMLAYSAARKRKINQLSVDSGAVGRG